MSFRVVVLAGLAVPLIGSVGLGADKQAVRVEPIGDVPENSIILAPSLATADTCFVSDNQQITTRIDGWVVGYELYKSLMIPANQCPNAYPFTVTAVNMPMMFDAATPITVGVDVEAVDSTTIPGCPVPGVLLAMSSEWDAQVPAAGMYNIWVPLDTPVVVNGPFFAGFYIGNTFEPGVNPAVLCDEFPVPCATFNIWDESIGWIDLVDNDYWDFPGRLAMEAAGIPGGSAGTELALVTPYDGEVLYGAKELWAWDRAASGAVDYVMFEYSAGDPYVEIGRDFDGSSPLRNGIDPSVSGTGFSINWDFAALPEGYYSLRVTMVDTLGGSTSDTVTVYLEPTPPVASVTSPAAGSPFCTPVDINMSSSDENLAYIQVFRRQAAGLVEVGVTPMNQAAVGDVDGDTADGNHAYDGEFGDYYSAPVAATMASRVWANRGHPGLVQSGSGPMSDAQVAEAYAAVFRTREHLGTYDEDVILGLRSYAASKGGGFRFDYLRNPAYADLRIQVEDDEKVVMLGLGDNPGLWVTVDGLAAWKRADSTYQVSVANPLSGTIVSASWRDHSGYSELSIGGTWHRIDIMATIIATDWSISRTMVGADFSGQDGWSVTWSGSGVLDDTYHYLRSAGHDYDDYLGTATVLREHNCAAVYIPGDYDNDRATTISDLFILIDFIARDGPPPGGGVARADCNCDNVVNITDIIYYMNYLYGTASAPCR